MVEVIKDEAERLGAEVEVVDVQHLDVRPYIACMKCRSSKECVLPEDDAQRILQLIQGCDALIIGTPCYWGNIPGTLKLLFDRMVYGMMGEKPSGLPIPLHRGKKAVIVTTCSTTWPFNILANQTQGVVKALKKILGWSGFSIVAKLQKGGTLKHPEFTDKNRKKCIKIVKKLDLK